MTSVVQLQPVENRPASDHRARQGGESLKVPRQEVAYWVLKQNVNKHHAFVYT